jgi:hypothetical protein
MGTFREKIISSQNQITIAARAAMARISFLADLRFWSTCRDLIGLQRRREVTPPANFRAKKKGPKVAPF